MFAVCLALFLALAQQPPPTEGARLSGWTLADDGSPLAGVEVVLACPPRPVKRTQSDERGRFELADLPTADCRLFASKRGHVNASVESDAPAPGGYGLRVVAGTWRDGFEMRLARAAIVTGRIHNYRGGESRNVRVHPIRREIVNGALKLNPMAYLPVSPSGSFEFTGVPPGEYYFAASPKPADGDSGGSSGYAMTYFPGTARLSDAQPFTLKPGETRQLDFAMAPTRAFTVSGIVYDVEGKPRPNTKVALSVEGELHWLAGETQTGDDGTFALTGVAPGRYVLSAGNLKDFVELHIDVDATDVGNLIARTGPRR